MRNLIETNVEHVINVVWLNKKSGLDWWMNLAHGIVLTSSCAPLTCVKNISTLFIASTFTSESNFPWRSHPLIDNNLRWASTRVIHDGFEISRQEKIRFLLKKHVEETGKFPDLRVCSRYEILGTNCQRCEKCGRTITGLLLDGIDPNKCGFNINADTVTSIKESLDNAEYFKRMTLVERGEKSFNRLYPVVEWKDIQDHIPETIDDNLYGSKEFFEWLRDFDIMENAKKIKLSQMPRLFLRSFFASLEPLIHLFPNRVQKITNQIFKTIFTK